MRAWVRPLIRACQRFKTEIQAGSQLEPGELLIDKEVTGGNVRMREILYRFEDGSSAHRI